MESRVCIELCGFPASGKTFLLENTKTNSLKRITTEEIYSYVITMSRTKRNISTFLYALINPLLSISLIIYGIQLSGKNLYPLKRAFLFIKFLMIYDYIYRNEKKSYIMDQGIIQFMWSISSQNDEEGLKPSTLLKLILSKLEKKYNFTVIYYQVPIEMAARRASNRNTKCDFDSFNEEKINNLYRIHKYDFIEILNHLKLAQKFIVNSLDDFKKKIIQISL